MDCSPDFVHRLNLGTWRLKEPIIELTPVILEMVVGDVFRIYTYFQAGLCGVVDCFSAGGDLMNLDNQIR